jgi:aryl-alcohol dehydrogenase-like predicted oxidoreductase
VELLPLTHVHNVGVTVGGVFYQGFLSLPLTLVLQRAEKGLFWPWDMTEKQRERVTSRLRKVSEFIDNDLTALRRLAIRFVLSEPRISVSVVGMKRAAEVRENLSAVEEGALDTDTLAHFSTIS